jgi:hypothetical protein
MRGHAATVVHAPPFRAPCAHLDPTRPSKPHTSAARASNGTCVASGRAMSTTSIPARGGHCCSAARIRRFARLRDTAVPTRRPAITTARQSPPQRSRTCTATVRPRAPPPDPTTARTSAERRSRLAARTGVAHPHQLTAHDRLRPTTACGPWNAGAGRSPGRRGSASDAGSRACASAGGYSAGRCASSLARSHDRGLIGHLVGGPCFANRARQGRGLALSMPPLGQHTRGWHAKRAFSSAIQNSLQAVGGLKDPTRCGHGLQELASGGVAVEQRRCSSAQSMSALPASQTTRAWRWRQTIAALPRAHPARLWKSPCGLVLPAPILARSNRGRRQTACSPITTGCRALSRTGPGSRPPKPLGGRRQPGPLVSGPLMSYDISPLGVRWTSMVFEERAWCPVWGCAPSLVPAARRFPWAMQPR